MTVRVASLRVAVDFDDVSADFFAQVITSMNKEFGTSIEKRHITTWDDNAVKNFDWARYGYTDWLDWLRQNAWLWALAPAIDGAIGGVRELRLNDHEPELLTSKPAWAEAQVWKWLSRWKLPVTGVRFVDLRESKALASDADILVDDNGDNCWNWVGSSPDRYAVLFRQPWNVSTRFGLSTSRLFPAEDWHDVVSIIEYLEATK